jgi:hypothetical protein
MIFETKFIPRLLFLHAKHRCWRSCRHSRAKSSAPPTNAFQQAFFLHSYLHCELQARNPLGSKDSLSLSSRLSARFKFTGTKGPYMNSCLTVCTYPNSSWIINNTNPEKKMTAIWTKLHWKKRLPWLRKQLRSSENRINELHIPLRRATFILSTSRSYEYLPT